MADSSFDIVSKVERQEVDNALNQASKEIAQRYDFKGVGASIDWSGEKIEIRANAEERAKAVLAEVGALLEEAEQQQASGKEYKIFASIKEGIAQDDAKKVAKIIRDEGPKGVKAQVQGDELRVSSKSRDGLQEVQQLLKGKDLDFAMQFVNYR